MIDYLYCKSRYGVPRYIRIIDDTTVQVYGKSEFIRCSAHPTDIDRLDLFDFEGGPCFVTNELMFNSDNGAVIFNNKTIVNMKNIIGNECGVEIKLK